MFIKVKRKYLSGPSAGEVETLRCWVGPYIDIVLDAQTRRDDKPIRRTTATGDLVEEYDFQSDED